MAMAKLLLPLLVMMRMMKMMMSVMMMMIERRTRRRRRRRRIRACYERPESRQLECVRPKPGSVLRQTECSRFSAAVGLQPAFQAK